MKEKSLRRQKKNYDGRNGIRQDKEIKEERKTTNKKNVMKRER